MTSPNSGRVSYSPELAEKILDRISEGESLRRICADDGMPDRRPVLRWLEADQELATKCARARELQADSIFDELREIAEDGNPEDVQRAKLRVSTLQWMAAKLAPKRYGDKLVAEHSGPNGGAIPFETVIRKVVDPKGEK